MKKLILIFLMLCLTQTVYAARENLYLTFKDNKEIKIYLEEVTDAEKNPEVSLKEFTVIFAKALSERMEKKFYFVDRAADADVLVSVNIRQYVYDEKVMPSVLSAAALAADVMTPKSSAKLVVDYKVVKASSGEVLLEYKKFTTVERPPAEDITAQKAFVFAADKSINRFLYRTFDKQKKKPLVR